MGALEILFIIIIIIIINTLFDGKPMK